MTAVTHINHSFHKMIYDAKFISQEEERTLIANVQNNNCMQSAKRLAESHFRYVASVARKFANYGLEVEDLIQQGIIGLLKSIQMFKLDAPEGVRFITYAALHVKAEIVEYVLDNVRSYRIATTKAQRKLFFNLNKYQSADRVTLSADEVRMIACDLDVTENDVRLMEAKLRNQDQSIDDEDNVLLEHSLVSNRTDPARLVEKEQWEEVTIAKATEAIDSLSERERDVFYHRVVAEDKKTLAKLAEEQGCSVERIRQVEARATKKVREFIQRFV